MKIDNEAGFCYRWTEKKNEKKYYVKFKIVFLILKFYIEVGEE